MTQPQGQEDQSAFNKRSDNAAQALKQAMGLPNAQVEVDANGRPPAPPPPKDSYAALAAAQYRDEAVAAQARLHQAEQAAQQPDQDTTPPTPREQLTNDISDKAAERISDLVSKLRDKDQQFQQLQTQHTQTAAQIDEMKQIVENLRREREELRRTSLESLDPEERARILGQLELQDAMQRAQEQILSELRPRLERIDQHELAREYDALARDFPGVFDARVHPELITQFRKGNPNCSVRLAFQAVLSPDELHRLGGGARPANPVPPSIAPTHTGIPKSVPTQHVSHPHRSDPDAEIAEEAQAAYKLLRSRDSADQKQGMRAVDAMLNKRLFRDR